MITKLTVDQISLFWPLFKFATVATKDIPDGKSFSYTNEILKNCLAGNCQVWIGYDRLENGIDPYALAISSLVHDNLTGLRYLSLDTLYGIRPIDDSIVRSELETIYEFARSQECSFVQCNAENKRVMELLEASGMARTKTENFKKFL